MQSLQADSKTSYLINDRDDETVVPKSKFPTKYKVLIAVAVLLVLIGISGTVAYFVFIKPNQGVKDTRDDSDVFFNTIQLSTDIPQGTSQYFTTNDFPGISLKLTGSNEMINLIEEYRVFDRNISSFKIGQGKRVQLCKNIGCRMDNPQDMIEILGPYQSSNLRETDKWIRAIKTFPYDELKEPRLQFFGKSSLHPFAAATFTYQNRCHKPQDMFSANIGVQDEEGFTSLIIPSSMDVMFFRNRECIQNTVLDLKGPQNYEMINPVPQPNVYYEDRDNTIKSFFIKTKDPILIYMQWERIGDDFNYNQISANIKSGLIKLNTQYIQTPRSYTPIDQIVQYSLTNQIYFMNETYVENREPQSSQIINGDTFVKLSQKVSQDILKNFTKPFKSLQQLASS
eukprot:403353792